MPVGGAWEGLPQHVGGMAPARSEGGACPSVGGGPDVIHQLLGLLDLFIHDQQLLGAGILFGVLPSERGRQRKVEWGGERDWIPQTAAAQHAVRHGCF